MTTEAGSTVRPALERLGRLTRTLAASTEFAAALDEWLAKRSVSLDGVWGSACALVIAAVVDRDSTSRPAPRTLVVVAPKADDIDVLAEDLRLFTDVVADKFPAWETEPGEHALRDDIYGERLRTLKRLARPEPPRIIVTSIQSLVQPTPDRESVVANTRYLRVGDRIDFEQFPAWLAQHRYHPTSAVELPGEFSLRGGILDVFAPDWNQPVRIELFDDQIESLRKFDIESQRSLERLEAVEITALDPDPQGRRAFLSDHLPEDSAFLLIELAQIDELGRHYLQRLERPEQCHSVAAVLREAGRFPLITCAAVAADATHRLPIESVERFSGDIDKVRPELDRIGEGQEVFVVAQTDAEIERLGELLRTTAVAQRGGLHFPRGTLHRGFRLLGPHAVVISASELFHRGELRRVPRRRFVGQAIDSFFDLREGDLVVHLAHGIGRYRGIELLTKDGHTEEHLKIEFAEQVKIFVPATKIDLVQKYIGGTKSRPTLARIGGKTWVRQKRAAEAAVTDMAADLLELQASRATRPGIAFAPDTEWQHEFDASFPYTETADQLEAIVAIKQDMQTARPMDRLLCGDVGFGKTEVAMRAAFKAIDSGYQVAVLVPTTILAEQHYHSFRERMAQFPFDIARLSRFCPPDEEREIVAKLGAGQVDIVIGTHRLASKDVNFHNLGLLIIDEEQRFGVEVKERLKTLRTTVDVLTLSATPIPRTLHMSLVGLRDISNLQTPPEDRLAVETRVTRWDDQLVRHAILRELSRGGQVYFVHNRVEDIAVVQHRLEYLVPEATFRFGHGQMHEHDLERVMADFIEHKFDVLVATTIVESGLDIPNANTIFIDEAHRYGLADLHQLRGRVGRYKHRAYCYLLIDPGQSITPNAAKRLRAIEEFSDMGAGFAIAMRDLEIRGAGNLLGTQQSGHIAAVGYELYCQLLENAVHRLKQLPPKLSLDVDIDLPGQAFFPADYVPEIRPKIDLYRRLTRIANLGDLTKFREELGDRFGEPPPQVQRMLDLIELKIDAAIWQISSIFVENQYLVFRYGNKPRIEQLAKLSQGRLRVVDEKSAYVTIPPGGTTADALLRLASSICRPQRPNEVKPGKKPHKPVPGSAPVRRADSEPTVPSLKPAPVPPLRVKSRPKNA